MYIIVYVYIYVCTERHYVTCFLCHVVTSSRSASHLPRSAAGRGGIGRAARRTWHLGQIYWLRLGFPKASMKPGRKILVESPWIPTKLPKPSKSWFQFKQDPIQLVDALSQSRWSSRAPWSVPTSSVCGAACAICAAGEASFGLVIGFPWSMVLPHREALLSSR
jgi:hypothetical protein